MTLPMDPDELHALLAHFRWSQAQLAAISGRHYERVRKMARGAALIDPPLAAWLRSLAKRRTAAVEIFEDRICGLGLIPPPDADEAAIWAPKLARCADLACRSDVIAYHEMLNHPPPIPPRLSQEQPETPAEAFALLEPAG